MPPLCERRRAAHGLQTHAAPSAAQVCRRCRKLKASGGAKLFNYRRRRTTSTFGAAETTTTAPMSGRLLPSSTLGNPTLLLQDIHGSSSSSSIFVRTTKNDGGDNVKWMNKKLKPHVGHLWCNAFTSQILQGMSGKSGGSGQPCNGERWSITQVAATAGTASGVG